MNLIHPISRGDGMEGHGGKEKCNVDSNGYLKSIDLYKDIIKRSNNLGQFGLVCADFLSYSLGLTFTPALDQRVPGPTLSCT